MAASGSSVMSASIHFVPKEKRQKGREMAKKGAFDENDKKMVVRKSKNRSKNEDQKARNNTNNRFLITIDVLGSSGPIRFVVNEKDVVCDVIETALKSYAREGRLPLLGADATNFFLYCPDAGFDALSPSEQIGSYGSRNFVLAKKQVSPPKTEARSKAMLTRMGSGSWKWLSKSFKF